VCVCARALLCVLCAVSVLRVVALVQASARLLPGSFYSFLQYLRCFRHPIFGVTHAYAKVCHVEDFTTCESV
jgi:hypothetical protein